MPEAWVEWIRLLRKIESWTPSQLMPEPPSPPPLSMMVLPSTTANEMTPSCGVEPSQGIERSPFMWMPLSSLPTITLPRMSGRSPLFDT